MIGTSEREFFALIEIIVIGNFTRSDHALRKYKSERVTTKWRQKAWGGRWPQSEVIIYYGSFLSFLYSIATFHSVAPVTYTLRSFIWRSFI